MAEAKNEGVRGDGEYDRSEYVPPLTLIGSKWTAGIALGMEKPEPLFPQLDWRPRLLMEPPLAGAGRGETECRATKASNSEALS